MNIIINKEEKEYLHGLVIKKITIGSHLYGTNNENSDIDYLNIYKTTELELNSGLPNYHQFQYKDPNNIDWLYTSELQFWKNFYSGDSSINTDVVLFTDYVNDDKKLKLCRTYKVIKAYLGFAKRDLKQINKDSSKLFHAKRGLYCADKLINGKLPLISDIQDIYNGVTMDITLQGLIWIENEIRTKLNELYNSNEIKSYYIEQTKNTLFDKLLDSNNIKEFKY